MDENFENINNKEAEENICEKPDEKAAETIGAEVGEKNVEDSGGSESVPVYTDPNADVNPEDYAQTGYGRAQERAQYQYGQNSQQSGQQNSQYQYGQNQQTGQYRYDPGEQQTGQYQYGQSEQQTGQYQYGQNQQQSGQYQYSQGGQTDGQNQYGQNSQQGGPQDGQSADNGFRRDVQYRPNEYSYQQYPNGNAGMDASPMTMGDWLLTILVMMIPCVGIVLYFVWAFSSNGNINRRNFCRAQLIIMGVVLVLYIILAVVFGLAVAGNMVSCF